MALRSESPLAFRTLHAGALVEVRDYRCAARRGGPMGEEHSATGALVFLRRGAFCQHFGRRSVTADPNQIVFFSPGSSYRVSHPADCGDRGTVLAPAPRVLEEIARELEPERREQAPFPFVTAPCAPDLDRRQRELVRRLESGAYDALWAEETALALVGDALAAGYARDARPRPRRRAGTEADHAERAEAAKAYLARHLGERVRLDDVARSVHASPFHLARLFQRHTGVPVHRYLQRLRLRTALERLADGADDLTALALALGFASHSHFTFAFRAEFGRTPSAVRAR